MYLSVQFGIFLVFCSSGFNASASIWPPWLIFFCIENFSNFSDIKFVVGSKKEVFYAHRCILAARCPVFKAMFTDQNQKNDNADPKIPLVLSDTDPNIFRVMIEFIYTNCATLSNKTVSKSVIEILLFLKLIRQ